MIDEQFRQRQKPHRKKPRFFELNLLYFGFIDGYIHEFLYPNRVELHL